ncbi:MAG: S-layer homology domain-containing protein [Clostridia bacterium]|nr:S-layer homology domain-containing protein [Clostridia bacterium]
MIKKLFSIMILFILVFLATGVKADDFNDVNEADWFYEDVKALENKGIINGFSDHNFRPDEFVTYEQFIKMIIKVLEIKTIENPDNWSLPYLEKAKEMKLIDTSVIDYKASISRGEMALILSDTLDYMRESVSITFNNLYDLPGVTPVKYTQSILELYNAGIITGFPDHTFLYEEKMTRAQACAVLNRLITPNKRQIPVAASSYSHGTASPYFKEDNGGYYEIINQFETVTDYHIENIIRTLAGDDGYLVIEYKKLSGFNLILVEYFMDKCYAYKEEYSMFTLYLYDGSPGYPEKEWGYDTMFSKLQIKTLVSLSNSGQEVKTDIDSFYEYKVRSLLCCIFDIRQGKEIGNYVIYKYLDNHSLTTELKEKDSIRTIFFTNGSQTVKNFTFTRLE